MEQVLVFWCEHEKTQKLWLPSLSDGGKKACLWKETLKYGWIHSHIYWHITGITEVLPIEKALQATVQLC